MEETPQRPDRKTTGHTDERTPRDVRTPTDDRTPGDDRTTDDRTPRDSRAPTDDRTPGDVRTTADDRIHGDDRPPRDDRTHIDERTPGAGTLLHVLGKTFLGPGTCTPETKNPLVPRPRGIPTGDPSVSKTAPEESGGTVQRSTNYRGVTFVFFVSSSKENPSQNTPTRPKFTDSQLRRAGRGVHTKTSVVTGTSLSPTRVWSRPAFK